MILPIDGPDELGQIIEPFTFGGPVLRVDLSELYKTVSEWDDAHRGEVNELEGPARRLQDGGARIVRDAADQTDTLERVRGYLTNTYPDFQEWRFRFIVDAIPDIAEAIEDLEEDTEETELRQSFPGRADAPARNWEDIYEEIRDMIRRGPPRIP